MIVSIDKWWKMQKEKSPDAYERKLVNPSTPVATVLQVKFRYYKSLSHTK
jgi:hypothetical protein